MLWIGSPGLDEDQSNRAADPHRLDQIGYALRTAFALRTLRHRGRSDSPRFGNLLPLWRELLEGPHQLRAQR